MKYKEVTRPFWRFWTLKHEKRQLEFNQGYEWAAAKLVSGQSTVEKLRLKYACSESFDLVTHFDRGMLEAAADYHRHGVRTLIKHTSRANFGRGSESLQRQLHDLHCEDSNEQLESEWRNTDERNK